MNREECNLTTIDIHVDPVEWVVAAYLNFMAAKIVCPLKADGMLCGEAGSELVAVYGFRGNYDMVTDQLTTHLAQIANEIPTEDLRDRIVLMVYAHIQYMDTSIRINPYYTAYTKAKRSGDLMLVGEVFDRYVEWNKRLHDNKQCLCFSN